MSVKNFSTKKNGIVTFFSQNWFVNLSKYICIFSDFLIIFENPVYRKMFVVFSHLFNRLSRNFLNVVRSLFTKTYPNFVTSFFKTKKKKKKNSKFRKKSEKIDMYSDKFIRVTKIRLSVFLSNNFFTTIFLITLRITNMTNQCSCHLANACFFSYFYPIRKYSKYSRSLTFRWECSDTH